MKYFHLVLIINFLQNTLSFGVLRNVDFQDEPENMTAVIGEAIVLKCMFTVAAPVCHWRKNDNYFMPDGERQHFIMKPDGNCALHIKFVKMMDTGWYKCVYPEWIQKNVPALWSKPAFLDVIESEQDAIKISVHGSDNFLRTGEYSYEITKNQIVNLNCGIRKQHQSTSYRWQITASDGSQSTPFCKEPSLQLNVTSALNVKCAYEDEKMVWKPWSREITLDAVYAASEVNTSYRHMTGNLILLNCFANGFPQPNIIWQMFDSSENDWKTISTSPKSFVNASKSYTYYRCLAANKISKKNISNEIAVPKLNMGITEIEICIIIGACVIFLLIVVPSVIFAVGAYKRQQLCFKAVKAQNAATPSLKMNSDWERACSEQHSIDDRSNSISIGINAIVSFQRNWPVPNSPSHNSKF